MIQVEGLTKYYGSYKAIDRLSFHADKGEILGFLGPNGAGKTTTMRILTGYMPPTEGTATLAGYDIMAEPLKARAAVGYLPESVPLYREMTVWQYVEYLAELYGMGRKQRLDRVGEVLEMVGMLDRADSMIANLSKGMRQRVGLAQALVFEPQVLILDEPTIGLDPAQVREVRELIKTVGENRTVMLSTHILTEVEQMCSRVLVINKGQIVAEDAPENLGRRLQGTARMRVIIDGAEASAVRGTLRGLPGVIEVAEVSPNQFEVTTESDKEVRPAVAAAVVAQNWNLLELRTMDMSLEDIFLQLVTDQDAYAEEE